jgi:hypothetical protein
MDTRPSGRRQASVFKVTGSLFFNIVCGSFSDRDDCIAHAMKTQEQWYVCKVRTGKAGRVPFPF